ncbi:sodium:solute symporter [Nesterenkonia sp. NBAIMH1]|uniref:sodium:solute symporter family protein n=1 Tax=Nesterenkonia sp. NBAIMH1 TaxID=2600320 RepID=UPI0011B3DBD8|nr:sodium:solute symporter family protein [Nesterenkonia sp. NBAIMH1]
MEHRTVTNIVVLICYLLLMVAFAAWLGKRAKIKTGTDFVLAGQSLPAWVLAGTLLTTFVGSGSIIGGASFVFQNGPLAGIFFFLGTLLGALTLGFLAQKIRRKSFHTVPQLLRTRFGRNTGTIGTLIVLVAFMGIAATQFTGAGYIFSLITPLSQTQGAVVAVLLITFLALAGGLKSVAWTDFLSAIIIIVGLVAAVGFVFVQDIGGFGSYVDRLDPALSTLTGPLTPLQILGYFLPLFLLCLGDQNMHQRLSAAKSPKTAQRAALLFFLGGLTMIIPIILLASSATIVNPGSEPDMAVLGLAAGGFTPELVGAVILVTALALIVTTGSSYLLTCSGNIVYDLIFRDRARREASAPGRQVLTARLAVIGIAICAYILVQFFPTLLDLQMYAYTMYGAAVTPAVLAALFWKRVSAAGAAASMITGGIVTVLWEVFGEGVNSVVVAFPVAVAALVLISLATKPAPALEDSTAAEREASTV